MDFKHEPVMLTEAIEILNLKPGSIAVDGTLGGGGHALEILRRIVPGGFLVGIDRDPNAIAAAREKLQIFPAAFTVVHDNYLNIKDILANSGIDSIDAMIMDLGVSSHQLDQEERGFTYHKDVNLDMRMDTTQNFSAYDVVNGYSEQDLKNVIRKYGEERWAGRIAHFIIKNRPIETTGKLVHVIDMAIPASARRGGPHPARRTFQAIRIEVNQELELLEEAVKNSVDVLKPGGRLCVISFHSLEDRIIKHTFQKLNRPCICPSRSPVCTCGKKPIIEILTKKPLTPGKDELERNPRARSAKLRACQKLQDQAGIDIKRKEAE